jgi:hypothetical protein
VLKKLDAVLSCPCICVLVPVPMITSELIGAFHDTCYAHHAIEGYFNSTVLSSLSSVFLKCITQLVVQRQHYHKLVSQVVRNIFSIATFVKVMFCRT